MRTFKRLVLAGLFVPSFASEAWARNPNPGVVPIGHSFHGTKYSEWAGEWWQWTASIPTATDPVADTTGEYADLGQSGAVWFLAGSWGETGVVRTVTIPADKYLLVPILNWGWVNIEVLGDDPWSPDQRDYAWSVILPFLEADHELGCEIDDVSVSDIESYWVATDDGDEYMMTYPDDNYFGIPAGSYGPSIDAGYYLLLRPLAPGEHTIHISAAVDSYGFALDVTYELTVEERDRSDHGGPGPGR